MKIQKSAFEPNEVFNSIGYQYDLLEGVVSPTHDSWDPEDLGDKAILFVVSPRK